MQKIKLWFGVCRPYSLFVSASPVIAGLLDKNGDTDNYMEIVQNISRNFTDMKLMRDRVVNKTQCEPMPQAE